jgi:hypothetical protein
VVASWSILCVNRLFVNTAKYVATKSVCVRRVWVDKSLPKLVLDLHRFILVQQSSSTVSYYTVKRYTDRHSVYVNVVHTNPTLHDSYVDPLSHHAVTINQPNTSPPILAIHFSWPDN